MALAAAALTVAAAVVVARRWPGHGTANPPIPTVSSLESRAGRPTLWVLSIGVSRYRDPALALRFAAADARAVADELAAQNNGPLYRAVETETLLDDAVTRGSILRALDEFLGRAAPIDVGVIYMAGHGARDAARNNYYFLPAPAAAEKPQIEGLEMDDFNRQLRLLHRNLRRLVVILDTCHAGAAADARPAIRLGEDLAARLAPAEGLYILAAAKSGEDSRELATAGHGAFTKAILDGLEGMAADADGLIRILGLASYAARAVPQLAGPGQTPYLSIVGEDLPLAAQPARFAQVTPPPLPSPAPAVPARPRERIAVMNFENLRPDPRHDWMQQVLSEQFASTLHEVASFDVYDERMVRFLARGTTDPLEASQRADMAELVDGTYWVDNGHISITAHVKSTNPVQSIAAARIEGPLDQFSDLSNRVVIQLLQQLHLDLSAAELERLARGATSNLAARKLLFDAERGSGQPDAPPDPDAGFEPHAWLGDTPFGRLAFATTGFAADVPDAEAQLRATLDSYRQAFERQDIEALARHYVEFTPQQRAALARYFANADGLRVEFSDVRIAMIGDRAAVSFNREDHFVDRSTGESQQVVARVTKLFAKGPLGWRILPEE